MHREGDGERVLVVQTLAAPPLPARRRRRPRDADAAGPPPQLPLARATAIRAFEPFDEPTGAATWLADATASEEAIDGVVGTAVALLNDALHAQAVAAADPSSPILTAERAVSIRLGYGGGDQVAAGAFTAARKIDVTGGSSRRRRRQEELRPQERLAAVLRGRERFDVCEPLLLRARADLDAGRSREAALQLRIAVEALLAELPEALDDPDHHDDIAVLKESRTAVDAAAERALQGDLGDEAKATLRASLQLAERILRRRRVLAG